MFHQLMDVPAFEDRTLFREEPPGEAFQKFITEYYGRTLDANHAITGFPARGNDGAIDLVIERHSKRERIFIEAKFHAQSRGDSPYSDWRTVANHLLENLPKLCRVDPATARRSLYFPWIDRDSPVTGYLFCTSATFRHESERLNLIRVIKETFYKLAAQDSSLKHFSTLDVDVLGWAQFQEKLKILAPLRYRWFGGLPTGVRLIGHNTGPAGSFRRFLDGDHLPYFGSVEFAAAQKDQLTGGIPSVADLLDTLLDSERGSLLIGGAGGLGKTRLALEVGRRADAGGLLALTIDRLSDDETIKTLARNCPIEEDVVIVVDYAETFETLDRIAATVEALAAEGHQFHIVANCRNSAWGRVRRALKDLYPAVVPFDQLQKTDIGSSYINWVVEKILEQEKLHLNAKLFKLCKGRPVLSAFAIYLHRENPESFDEQFSTLAADSTFESWVETRLHTAFSSEHGAIHAWPRTSATLMASMPLAADQVRRIRDSPGEGAEILDLLEKDQWIERDGSTFVAAHDVFADEIIAHYLFEQGQPVHTHAGDLLTDARRQGSLDRALVALDRLAAHPGVEELNLAALLREQLLDDADVLAANALAILGSRLISPPSAIALISEDEPLRHALLASRAADLRVSQFAAAAADSAEPGFTEHAAAALTPLLERAVACPQPTNLILRRAFKLAPDVFRSTVLAEIKRAPEDHQTHFLVFAWLRKGFPLTEITEPVQLWLSQHGKFNRKASFVYRGWLEAGGGTAAVAENMRAWLDKHAEHSEAQFVYRSWLAAGGDREAVAEDVKVWLDKHGTDIDAGLIFRTWLDCDGGTEAVAVKVRAWLDGHRDIWHARSVYQSWLGAGGAPDSVAEDVKAWLDKHGTDIEASYVIQSWLDAGGAPEILTEHVRSWVQIHRASQVVQFVFDSWLRAGGEFDIFREDIFEWVSQYKLCLDVMYVAKFIVRQPSLPVQIAVDLMLWCRIYAEQPDAICRFGPLMKYAVDARGREMVSEIAIDILEKLNEEDLLDEGVFTASMATLSRLYRWINTMPNSKMLKLRLDGLYIMFVRDFRVYRDHPVAHKALVRHRNLIQAMISLRLAGDLVRVRDEAAISDFVTWLSTWPAADLEEARGPITVLSRHLYYPDLLHQIGLDSPFTSDSLANLAVT